MSEPKRVCDHWELEAGIDGVCMRELLTGDVVAWTEAGRIHCVASEYGLPVDAFEAFIAHCRAWERDEALLLDQCANLAVLGFFDVC